MNRRSENSLAAATCLIAALSGCATNQPNASDQSVVANAVETGTGKGAVDDPFGPLRRIAEKTSNRIVEIDPPDPKLAEISRDDPAWAIASTRLEDLTPDQFKTDDGAIDNRSATPPDPSAVTEALTLYAQARQRTAAGDASGAISLLERATSLDPMSPEPWRALAGARRNARFENSAGAAFVRAALLGIDEPEALTLAGLHAINQNETTQAVGFFLRAVRAEPSHVDPLISIVANAALGEALLELGYIQAGTEALQIGVDVPRAARVPTSVGREAVELQRKQSELLVRMGDAYVTLGEYSRASRAYERAGTIPGSIPVQEKLVYALRKSGNDAAAAIVLLDDLAEGAPINVSLTKALASVAESISPRSAVANAIAEIDDAGSATRRARLVQLRAAALPKKLAIRCLEEALAHDTSFSSPARRALMNAGIARFSRDDADDAIRWVGELVAESPAFARDAAAAMQLSTNLPPSVHLLIDEEIRDRTARLALSSEFALLLQDRDLTMQAIADHGWRPGFASELREDPISLERLARLASSVGNWDALDAAITTLSRSSDQAAISSVLSAAQRFEDALAAARLSETNGTSDRTVDEFLKLASLEDIRGNAASAKLTLERARDADPLDERVYAALIALHGPTGSDPDESAVAQIGRQVREILPESTLLRQILAGELLRRRLNDEAARLIVPLFRAEPTDPILLDAMLTLWRARAATSRSDANETDIVEALADRHPNHPGLVRLLTAGWALRDEPQRAIDRIASFEALTGDRSLNNLREQFIREGLNDPARADALAIARLAPAIQNPASDAPDRPLSVQSESPSNNRGINQSVLLAGIYASGLAAEDGLTKTLRQIRDVLTAIPNEAELTTAQRAAARNAVARAAVAVDSRRRSSNAALSRSLDDPIDDQNARALDADIAMLKLLNWATERNIPLAAGIHELRLVLLTETDAADADIVAAAETAIAENANTARAFIRRAADLLVENGSEAGAFEWLASRSLSGNETNGSSLQEWFRLVIVSGKISRGREFIDRVESAGMLAEAWALVRPDAETWSDRDTADAAEMAYLLALFAPDSANSGDARRAYLNLALEYNPRHPWACNDLGYTMLESGGDLAEAERLIQIAFESKPDQANIVDSLGWVRYHRNKLHDTTDETTGVVTMGAVSLLKEAIALSDSNDDGVVHDHLGDALYAAGETEDAIVMWRSAARLANQALSRMRAAGRTDGVRSSELSDLAVRAIMKPNAIQMGERPEIEPQRGVHQADQTETPKPAIDK